MSDVLLAHSNRLFSDPKQVEKMQPYPPLQPLLAAASLRNAGIDVAFCDVTFEEPENSFIHWLRDHSPWLLIICEDDFNFLSKMCLSRNRELAFWMASAAKEAGIMVAVHGPDSSSHVSTYLEAGIDYVMLGEVEATIVELAKQNPPEHIAGLAYRDPITGSIRYTRPRPFLKNLDALPEPAWDLVDMDRYRRAWISAHGYCSLNLVSSRGCPFHCNWCVKPYDDHYKAQSPRRVAEEMLHLKRRYHPDHIWFADDIFALSRAWTAEFADATELLDSSVPFKMQSRCDLMIPETVRSLKRAGCAEVWMGAESGSQRILNAMDKGLRVEQIYQAREALAEQGIRACFFLQFGYTGETWDDINETIRMVRETRPDDVGISVSYPLAGTAFFNIVASQLGDKVNWTHSGDLAMMFRGTYSSEFYRALAEAVRMEIRSTNSDRDLQRAWQSVYDLAPVGSATAISS